MDSLASLLWSFPLKDTETILLISQPDGVQWELETGTVRQGMAPNQEVPSLCWSVRVIHSLTLSPEFPELYCLISTSGCKASGSSYQGDDASQENGSPVSGRRRRCLQESGDPNQCSLPIPFRLLSQAPFPCSYCTLGM